MEGLNITENEFRMMKPKEQMTILFQNTQEIKELVSGFKFQQKVQYVLIGILFVLLGAGKIIGLL